MAKRALFFSAFFCFVFITLYQALSSSHSIIPADQVITYPLYGQQYVVIVVKDGFITKKQAEEEAKRQAAQITLDHGYRYFSILSSYEVQMIKGTQDEKGQMPRNMYQELIIEKNFTRDTDDYLSSASVVPATRFVIECFHEKPRLRKSYDATDFF